MFVFFTFVGCPDHTSPQKQSEINLSLFMTILFLILIYENLRKLYLLCVNCEVFILFTSVCYPIFNLELKAAW